MCSFCHVAFVVMPFCFFTQNFAEIGQSVDELWPKKLLDRPHATFYWSVIVNVALSCTIFELFAVE